MPGLNFSQSVAVVRSLDSVQSAYLGTEAIVKAETDVHQREGSGFIQEVSQKAADTVVRPVAMDQKQSAQEVKLCQ